jgi:hypothetical protein
MYAVEKSKIIKNFVFQTADQVNIHTFFHRKRSDSSDLEASQRPLLEHSRSDIISYWVTSAIERFGSKE